MAAIGRAAETVVVEENIYDNTAKEITPEKARTALAPIIESNFNLVDDKLKDANYDTGVLLSEKFTSVLATTKNTLTTWGYNTTVTVTHNIGVAPLGAFVLALCTSSQYGYAPGDIVQVANAAHNYENEVDGGLSLQMKAINSAELRIGDAIYVLQVSDRRRQVISAASWDLVINFIHPG